jgi:hypothetical protein
LSEFRAAGFDEVVMLKSGRNARTKNPRVLAAEVRARRAFLPQRDYSPEARRSGEG